MDTELLNQFLSVRVTGRWWVFFLFFCFFYVHKNRSIQGGLIYLCICNPPISVLCVLCINKCFDFSIVSLVLFALSLKVNNTLIQSQFSSLAVFQFQKMAAFRSNFCHRAINLNIKQYCFQLYSVLNLHLNIIYLWQLVTYFWSWCLILLYIVFKLYDPYLIVLHVLHFKCRVTWLWLMSDEEMFCSILNVLSDLTLFVKLYNHKPFKLCTV